MRKSHQIPQLSLSELFSLFEVRHEKPQEKKIICVCKLKLSLLTEAKLKLASVNKLCTLNLEFALFNLPALLLQVKAKLLFLPNVFL